MFMGARSSAKKFLGSSDPGAQRRSLQRRPAWVLYCEEAHILSTVTPRSTGKCTAYVHKWFTSLARSGSTGLLMCRPVLFCSLRIISKTSSSRKRLGHQNEALKEVLWHKRKEKLALLGLQYCSLSRTHPARRHPDKK